MDSWVVTELQAGARDFFENTSFWWVFGMYCLDGATGTIVAIRDRCWNSQMASKGLSKLVRRRLSVLAIEYLCRKADGAEGAALGTGLVGYVTCIDFGSALENVGAINNDTTLTIYGRALRDRVAMEVMTRIPQPPPLASSVTAKAQEL